MKKNRKWTKDDDNTILQCIKRANTNKEGFEQASKILSVKYNTIAQRYQKKLLVDENRLKHKWNKKEIKVLLNNIKNYPTNIRYALELTSQQLKLKINTIYNKWYGHTSCKHLALRNNPEIYQLTCGSKLGFSQNIKINSRKRNEEGNLISPPQQILKPFEVMVNQMLQLSLKDRTKVINYFINNDNSVKISNSNININSNNKIK